MHTSTSVTILTLDKILMLEIHSYKDVISAINTTMSSIAER